MKLREVAFSESPQVDKELGIIRNVKILGSVSLNGRRYTESAIKNAVPMYNGQHVNVDHRVGLSEQPRGVMEQVGIIQNAVIGEDGGIYGDLHMLTSHISAPALMERAEKFPRSFGLSHDAQGTVAKDDEGFDVVEELTEVNSVDIVSEPASTAGLFESLNNKKRPKMKKTLREFFTKTAKNSPAVRAILEAEDEELQKALDAELPVEVEEAEDEDEKVEDEKVEEEEPAIPVDIPVEAPVAADDPAEAVRVAISNKIMAIVNDGSEASTQIGAIKKLLVARDKVTAEMGSLVADAVEARIKPLEAKLDLLLEVKNTPPHVGRKYEITEPDGKYKSMDQIFD